MRIHFSTLILLAILLAACAAPTPAPTAAPPTKAPEATRAPQPTAAPPTATSAANKSPVGPAARTATAAPQSPLPVVGATPVPIKVEDVKQAKLADGSIRTTANVTADNLGLGQMEIASPETMLLGETRTIRLRIAPAQQVASGTPVAAPGKSPDLPNFVYKFTGNIQLYPVMVAELRTLSFDVDKKGQIRREIKPNVEVLWDWLISPRKVGRQELAIEISIPAVVNGIDSELMTLQDLPIAIVVQEPPPPSTWDRISESIADNAGAIIVALIGLIGTLIGIVYKLRSDQGSAGSKKSKS
jgi:hypothetical protein